MEMLTKYRRLSTGGLGRGGTNKKAPSTFALGAFINHYNSLGQDKLGGLAGLCTGLIGLLKFI